MLLSITGDKHTWLAVLTILGEYLSLDFAIATIFFSPPTLRTCLKRSKNRIISIQQTLNASTQPARWYCYKIGHFEVARSNCIMGLFWNTLSLFSLAITKLRTSWPKNNPIVQVDPVKMADRPGCRRVSLTLCPILFCTDAGQNTL